LVLDAVQRAEAGRGDEALASARGALLAGRSVGDEPLQAAWWTDLICSDYAARAVERILAQTEPSPGALAATQALLERQRHDLAPNLLWMLRSERAAHHRVFAGLALGTIKRDEFDVDHYPGRGRSPAEEGQKGDYLRHRYRTCQALAVVEMTRLVQAFALPPEEQAAALDGIDSDLKKRAVRYAVADDWRKVSLQLLPPFIRLFKGRDKLLAALDGASVALAVERFLHDRGHLPARGEELVPAYLAAFPTDPFLPGQPLRFLRSDDHLVIYAVGPDRTDNQGYQTRAVGRNVDFVADGEDVGIRLWVSEQRRQPPPKPGP
jgi:hypothetical protein